MTYNVPGVFVEEISLLPPSVASVATAVPAFIGYTQRTIADEDGNPPEGPVVRRITTYNEFKDIFGGPQPATFNVTLDETNAIVSLSRQVPTSSNLNNLNILPPFFMAYSLFHYFANDGGPCYVVSVGTYEGAVEADELRDGIGAIALVDEVSLIVIPEAVLLANYTSIYQDALAQCGNLGDRFTIANVMATDVDGAAFRNSLSSDYLKYGAAYVPHLRTDIPFHYENESVTVSNLFYGQTDPNGLQFFFRGSNAPTVTIQEAGDDLTFTVAPDSLTITGVGQAGTVADIVSAWNALEPNEQGSFALSITGDGSVLPADDDGAIALGPANLSDLENSSTQLFNAIKAALGIRFVTLPPDGAVAGLYARVDRTRGVWKAPANASVNRVLSLSRNYTNEEQGRLNVDPTGGKSINAIRSFTGRGTLVWGARTLAGNDNEWRYINVRRLFNFIEESLQKATAFAVFEANDATTWLKVKGLIDSFLYSLFQQGALAGPTPEQAYFVNVGLGKTMTPQDILEGRLIVEVGIAAVRPAEFIILRFSHKLQEA